MADKTGETENSGLLDSVGFKPIVPYPEDDYVLEGTPEAEELAKAAPPPPSMPESKEELKAQLDAIQARLQAQEQQLKAPAQPFVQQAPPAKQETPEERALRLNNLWMENPSKAFEEQSIQQVRPVVDLLFQQGAVLSRELLMRDPQEKALYEKYKDEVEREVAAIPPQERAVEPRVYQTALERVKARHLEDVFEERVQEAVAKKLKELGIQPGSPSQPSVRPPTAPPQQTPTQKKLIPRSIVLEAERIGLDPQFLYEHRKAQGLIK